MFKRLFHSSGHSWFAFVAGAACAALSWGAASPGWSDENPGKNAGLLVVVHGSPSPAWNEPMSKLEEDLSNAVASSSGPFKAAKVANLEFAKPLIADGVRHLAEAGCERIVCMPLFIAHSSHVVYDLPAALGLFSSKAIHETLMEEGVEIADAPVPIVMGPTLSESGLLPESVLARVEELSADPENEALVIFAHGDEGIEGTWEHLAKRTAAYVCGKTGITYADWAFVEVGQSYATEGLSTIFRAAEYKKRILVAGLYLSMGLQRMHSRHVEARGDPFAGEDFEVVFSPRGFLHDPNIVAWLTATAAEVHGNRFSCRDR